MKPGFRKPIAERYPPAMTADRRMAKANRKPAWRELLVIMAVSLGLFLFAASRQAVSYGAGGGDDRYLGAGPAAVNE
ncbi:MAG TPA: hypothetical protein DDZ68_16320 [Parvularcula sp.]|nr:hypothetical protein [Parvularcula sp.]